MPSLSDFVHKGRFRLIVAALFSAMLVIAAAQAPDWWSEPQLDSAGVPLNPEKGVMNGTADDGAVATQGQLMHLVQQAKRQLDQSLAPLGGAGASIEALLTSYGTGSPAEIAAKNSRVATLGQVKYAASLFWKRLQDNGSPDSPVAPAWPYGRRDRAPVWTEDTNDDADASPALLGQLKSAFSFQIPPAVQFLDSDGDGFTDWQERFQLDTDPFSADSDGDGWSDWLEYHNESDPLDHAAYPSFSPPGSGSSGGGTSGLDSDGDGTPDAVDSAPLAQPQGWQPPRFMVEELGEEFELDTEQRQMVHRAMMDRDGRVLVDFWAGEYYSPFDEYPWPESYFHTAGPLITCRSTHWAARGRAVQSWQKMTTASQISSRPPVRAGICTW